MSTATLHEQLETKFGVQPPGAPSVLLNHRTQSATAVDGWKSVFFGLPFLAIGVFVLLAADGAISTGKHGPNWLIAFIGAPFALAGLFLFVHGIHGLARKAAYRRKIAERPDEPWLADHHWHREGISFSAFHDMLSRLVGALLWSAFLVPFAWIGATVHGAWPFMVAVVIFGLLSLILWVRWAKMLFDFLTYGNSFLAYESFPFALGGTLRTRLRAPRNISALDSLTLTLRCVEEKYVTTRVNNRSETNVVCYELYKDAVTYDRDRLTGLAGNDIPIELRIPLDQPTTTLTSTPPTYWEIEATGAARGVDYEAVFLVPVYKI
jgi:hypothetical protein